MTEIRVYHGVRARERFLARLLVSKLLPQSMQAVIVVSDKYAAEALDDKLWTAEDISFIPHCLASHKLADATPVIITTQSSVATAKVRDVMVIMGSQLPNEAISHQQAVLIMSEGLNENDDLAKNLRDLQERGFQYSDFDMSSRAH